MHTRAGQALLAQGARAAVNVIDSKFNTLPSPFKPPKRRVLRAPAKRWRKRSYPYKKRTYKKRSYRKRYWRY